MRVCLTLGALITTAQELARARPNETTHRRGNEILNRMAAEAVATLGMSSGSGVVGVPIRGALAPVGQWATVAVPLRCLRERGVDMQRVTIPWAINTAGRLTLSISDVRVASTTAALTNCGRP